MIRTKGMAPHEMLELHEILTSEAAAAQKMQASMAIVNDPELQAFMQDAVAARQRRVTQIETLISNVKVEEALH